MSSSESHPDLVTLQLCMPCSKNLSSSNNRVAVDAPVSFESFQNLPVGLAVVWAHEAVNVGQVLASRNY